MEFISFPRERQKGPPQWLPDYQQEIHDLWMQFRSEFPGGYRTFYGPVRDRPDLLCIGYNPGGTAAESVAETKLLEHGPAAIPARLDYFNPEINWRLAKVMRRVLGAVGLHEDQVCKTNLIPMRTPSVAEYKGVSKSVRRVVERVSAGWLDRTILYLRPRAVLVEGIGTWEEMLRLGVAGAREVPGAQGQPRKPRLGFLHDQLCIVLPHPSYGVNQASIEAVRRLLHESPEVH